MCASSSKRFHTGYIQQTVIVFTWPLKSVRTLNNTMKLKTCSDRSLCVSFPFFFLCMNSSLVWVVSVTKKEVISDAMWFQWFHLSLSVDGHIGIFVRLSTSTFQHWCNTWLKGIISTNYIYSSYTLLSHRGNGRTFYATWTWFVKSEMMIEIIGTLADDK